MVWQFEMTVGAAMCVWSVSRYRYNLLRGAKFSAAIVLSFVRLLPCVRGGGSGCMIAHDVLL